MHYMETSLEPKLEPFLPAGEDPVVSVDYLALLVSAEQPLLCARSYALYGNSGHPFFW